MPKRLQENVIANRAECDQIDDLGLDKRHHIQEVELFVREAQA